MTRPGSWDEKWRERLGELEREIPEVRRQLDPMQLIKRQGRALERIRGLLAAVDSATAMLVLGQVKELLYALEEPERLLREFDSLRETARLAARDEK